MCFSLILHTTTPNYATPLDYLNSRSSNSVRFFWKLQAEACYSSSSGSNLGLCSRGLCGIRLRPEWLAREGRARLDEQWGRAVGSPQLPVGPLPRCWVIQLQLFTSLPAWLLCLCVGGSDALSGLLPLWLLLAICSQMLQSHYEYNATVAMDTKWKEESLKDKN